MDPESTSKTTTQQGILHFYPLGDGRTVALQHARVHKHPVEVYLKDGQLFAGKLKVVLRHLSFLKEEIGSKGKVDLIGLVDFIDIQGVYFPGIYLYDCLYRRENQNLIPLFSTDTIIVFLGSRATCVSTSVVEPEETTPVDNYQAQDSKPSILSRAWNWLSGKDDPVVITPKTIQVTSTTSEVGYLAFRRDKTDGEIHPWFISQIELIEAITGEDDSILVVFAREPE